MSPVVLVVAAVVVAVAAALAARARNKRNRAPSNDSSDSTSASSKRAALAVLSDEPDAADVTKLRRHDPALPRISDDGTTEEPNTESKAVTLFEDEGAIFDEPTGPTELVLLHAIGTSDRGRKRKRNEDSYLAMPEHGLFVVADGMGGYAGGDVASALAVKEISTTFRESTFGDRIDLPSRPKRATELVAAIQKANSAIFESAAQTPDYEGMGTTVVAARFAPRKKRLYVGYVGDSRCYRLRDDKLKQITVDHTLAAKGVTGPLAANIRRAVGVKPKVVVDVVVDVPSPGDLYVICSDGLTKMLSDEHIHKIISGERRLEMAAQQLVEAANLAGGRDNVTVVLVGVRAPGDFPNNRGRRREDSGAGIHP